jgi:predicted lipid-binding transport protein (Tim44 family)
MCTMRSTAGMGRLREDHMFSFRLRPFLTALAVASAFAIAAAGVADARVGGGSSSGSRGGRTFSAPPATRTAPTNAAPFERSMAPRQTTPSPATTGAGGFFNRPGGLFGGGLLGGLAAGFIGAGLFGLLFGHGFMGGLGGLASMLGLLLQVGLVALVAMLVWRWWQRRNAPAYASAGGPIMRNTGPSGLGLGGGLGGGAALGANAARSGPSDELGIQPADFDAFERLLGEIQAAYSAEDLSALRLRVTPEMLSYFSDDLAANASRGVVNRISDVKLEQGDLAEAWREGDSEYATVAMRFSLVDRMVERASGRVVSGDEGPQETTELWTFRRSRGGSWLLSAIQQS